MQDSERYRIAYASLIQTERDNKHPGWMWRIDQLLDKLWRAMGPDERAMARERI